MFYCDVQDDGEEPPDFNIRQHDGKDFEDPLLCLPYLNTWKTDYWNDFVFFKQQLWKKILQSFPWKLLQHKTTLKSYWKIIWSLSFIVTALIRGALGRTKPDFWVIKIQHSVMFYLRRFLHLWLDKWWIMPPLSILRLLSDHSGSMAVFAL